MLDHWWCFHFAGPNCEKERREFHSRLLKQSFLLKAWVKQPSQECRWKKIICFFKLWHDCVTGLFKSSTKKFPNFDLVTSKRTSRSDEGPLDDAYGVYGLASDEEIDLSAGNDNLSWGNRRGKRNKVEATKVKQWNNLNKGK